MPPTDTDDLSDTQLAQLRTQLETIRLDLQSVLASSSEHDKPVELDEPIGRLSRMDAMQQQKILASNRRGHQIRLGRVIAALHTMESGDYGLCRECEEPIGFRRLCAKPETTRCVACQALNE